MLKHRGLITECAVANRVVAAKTEVSCDEENQDAIEVFHLAPALN